MTDDAQKAKIDESELWSVEVNKADIIGSIERKILDFRTRYHCRREEIKAIALGPNEFNALRFQLREHYPRLLLGDTLLAGSDELKVFDIPVYCSARIGIELLVQGVWHVKIEEARKHLSLEGLDA